MPALYKFIGELYPYEAGSNYHHSLASAEFLLHFIKIDPVLGNNINIVFFTAFEPFWENHRVEPVARTSF